MNVPVGVYRYRAAGVIDGDQSDDFTADANNESSEEAVPDLVGPVAGYLAVTGDTATLGKFQGGSDGRDLIGVIFDRAVVVSSGATITLVEGSDATPLGTEETWKLTCGSTSTTCATLGSSQSYGGVVHPGDHILAITLQGDITRIGTVPAEADGYINWPVYVTASIGIKDKADKEWNLGASSDRTAEVDVEKPAVQSVAGDESEGTIVLTYDRRVDCADLEKVRAQFTYERQEDPFPLPKTKSTPTRITCAANQTVVLGFDAGVLVDTDDAGTLTYTKATKQTMAVPPTEPDLLYNMRALNGQYADSPWSKQQVPVGP
jgi:hypothetical protein